MVEVVNITTGTAWWGNKAQLSNIEAGKALADIMKTCLGPQSMIKILMDPMGGTVVTKDGNVIFSEIDVAHPVVKSMLELSRAHDEEVGDGTTSVIILTGEVLAAAAPFLEHRVHPIRIINGFKRALEDALKTINEISTPINVGSDKEMLKLIQSSLGTKVSNHWSYLLCTIALKAVRIVAMDASNAPGCKEVDIKRNVWVEKILGGEIEECRVLDGVIINKDITHPTMRYQIEKPRIILLDCPLEYKKGESQMNIEIRKETDWQKVLELEEQQVKSMCDQLISFKPDVVITEKGVSDLAQHYLMQANVTVIRQVRKGDNNRIARAIKATIVNHIEDLKESDVGTGAGLFSVEKIGDEYFSFITKCTNPKACTILLRGASKDILNELERILQDAMSVVRNLYFYPKLCPGGGAIEMAVAVRLEQIAESIEGIEKWPYKAIASTLDVIPRTLVQNCGRDAIKVLTKLRAKHVASQGSGWGIDGINGKVVNMAHYGVWEPAVVKAQTIKNAIESACMILHVDIFLKPVKRQSKD